MTTNKIRYKTILVISMLWVFLVLFSIAHAEENQSSVSIAYEDPNMYIGSTDSIRYISQGDTVYLNDTVDVSGACAGYSELAYWDGYDMYNEAPTYNISFKYNRESYYKFYIDPLVFTTRLGKWYKYNGKFESNANSIAFVVVEQRPVIPMTLQNGSIINTTQKGLGSQSIDKPFILQEKAISDYLVSRGDYLRIDTGGRAKIWIGGTTSSILDKETSFYNITLSNKTISSLSPGEYSLVIQKPGDNEEFDVRYYSDDKLSKSLQYRNGWSGIQTSDISGYSPLLVISKLKETIGYTDDTYEEYSLVVEDPKVTVDRFDEISLSPENSEFDYYRMQTGLITVFDVRGYSNANEGTTIKIVLDPDLRSSKDLARHTFYATTVRTFPGNMSYYRAFVPIIWDEMSLDIHSIEVTDAIGARMEYTFPVGEMPADSFRPNATVKYVLDENPWKPNLTTNIVYVTLPTPTPEIKIVERVKEPTQEQIETAQRKIIVDLGIQWGVWIIEAGVVILIGFVVVRFLYRGWKRKRWSEK